MAQIVSASRNAAGNYVLEIKPLPNERLSKTGDTIHYAGTIGWAERLGLYVADPEGQEVELEATVDIRYKNRYAAEKPKKPKLTPEDLRKAAQK